ncbi:helix-turn-helix domain-containing protein [Chryseobacterium sp. RLHN22]|uniref:helix-turn-helix domain-containing protein n=1 Tax=Chryseobacterium sp. RLHN22 TaxID=3437885 RepID=UPI003D9ACE5D
MKKCKYFLFVFSLFSLWVYSQKNSAETYSDIRKNYEKMLNDDRRALPFVKLYINKAKKEKNKEKLVQGYRDARQYCVSLDKKFKYADSTIQAAIALNDSAEISKAYLSKGILFYFNAKKYKAALDHYLKAYQFAEHSKDQYHKYKVIYHMGIVKSHLGYYEKALQHFLDCTRFYQYSLEKDLHENELYNYSKGYYNSLHQLAVVYRYLGEFDKVDSLAELGLKNTVSKPDYFLENSYFHKSKGLVYFNKKDYKNSEISLRKALPGIVKRNDFATCSIIYLHLGKIYFSRNEVDKSMNNFMKIDSIFNKQQFILPEAADCYRYLMNNAAKTDNVDKQLYYTNQLLKADHAINKDFSYIASKICRDYDVDSLKKERDSLERKEKRKLHYAIILIGLAAVIIIIFCIRFYRDREIRIQYDKLQQKLNGNESGNDKETVDDIPIRKTSLSPELTEELLQKLKIFEETLYFKKKGLTQKSVATKLGTNSHYLSILINENKGVNFNRYMAELRINYITNLLNTDRKYLLYTIEALAEECGIAARQNFSALFYEINGIRPKDYIRKRKEELNKNI